MTLSEDDMTLALDFVDGLLDEAASASFERRLADEPALAHEVERLLATDETLREQWRPDLRPGDAPTTAPGDPGAGLHDTGRSWFSRFSRWSLTAAAAALAALTLFSVFDTKDAHDLDISVAAAPSWQSARAFLRAHPELEGLRPPGLDTLRAADEAPNIEVDEFLRRVQREQRAALSALADPLATTRAEFFRLPVRTERDISILVLAFPAKGTPERLWPASTDERGLASARLRAGEHVLPREPFARLDTPAAPAEIEYDPGFLVPVGCGELNVLVALRDAALKPAELVAIDQALRHDFARQATLELLRDQRFALREVRVVEGQN